MQFSSKIFYIIFFVFALSTHNTLSKNETIETNDSLVQFSVISKHRQVVAGKSQTLLAIRFIIKDDWHIYWRNPGDSGLPTEVEFELPNGFTIDSIFYPTPEKLAEADMVTYGYSDTVYFFVDLKSTENLAKGEYTIKAKANWLVCKNICLPGSADFEFNIKVGDEEHFNLDSKDEVLRFITNHRMPLPKKISGLKAKAYDEFVLLGLQPLDYFLDFDHLKETIEFYPYEGGYFSASKEQKLSPIKMNYQLTIPYDEYKIAEPISLYGLLVRRSKITNKTEAYQIDVTIE